MPEPGAPEGQAQKPVGGEPFPRKTGDVSSFSTGEEHLKSLVDQAKEETKPPFQRETGKDLSSYAEADVATQEMLAQEAYKNGDLEGFVKYTANITSPSPVFQKLMDEVGAGMQVKTGENPLVYNNWRTKVLQPLRFIAERFKIGESGQPYQRKELDLSSYAEAGNKTAEIVNNPELQKVMQELSKVAESVAVQDAAVGLVEGYVNWAKTTGDAKIPRLLSGNIAEIVQRFATNPDKVSETVEAWTEEEAQSFTKALEDKGIINKNQPPSATEPPATSAK